jgi:hypothetical protein
MRRLSWLTLVFALLSLLFINLLIFLRIDFPPYPLISYQDAFDLLTPLVLIPVYWLLFRDGGRGQTTLGEEIAFLLFAVLWVAGQGMHLSANSLDNLIEGLARDGVMDLQPTDVYALAYFFDEHLSHYLWHGGMLGLIAVLVYREWRRPAGAATVWWLVVLAGLIYSFTFFTTFLEGQTVFLGFPFAVALALFGMVWGRGRLSQRPVLAFFTVACLLAGLLFAGWWLYWGGFPELTEVGLI